MDYRQLNALPLITWNSEAGVNPSSIQSPGCPITARGTLPTGPPETRLEGSSFPSHMTLGLTAPVELSMFPPMAQPFISHLQTIYENPPHENSKAQQICSPVCFLRHSFRTTVFHLWVFSTWKSACILTGPFSFMEMNPKHQTLNENFNLSFESVNQFLVHRYFWKQGLGNQKTQTLCVQLCHLLAVCAWARLDFTCLVLFFSSVV